MQMLNLKQASKRLKKSQILLIGSLLVFVGCFVITGDYLAKMKEEVFSEMKAEVGLNDFVGAEDDGNDITDVPVADNLQYTPPARLAQCSAAV